MLKRLLFSSFLLFSLAGSAQVVLRLSASNPSRIAATEVELKKLLPERVERTDVLDSDGLDIVYDADAKRYCARQTITLEPGQKRVFTLRLRDIWVFPEEELVDKRKKAEEIAGILADTRGQYEAAILRDRIAKNVEQIIDLQRESTLDQVSIPEHISAYDRNEIRYEAILEDERSLEAVLSILGDEKILDEGEQAPIDVAMLWKIILVIITFVGVVTAICFFLWTGQLRKIRQAEREAGIDSSQ